MRWVSVEIVTSRSSTRRMSRSQTVDVQQWKKKYSQVEDTCFRMRSALNAASQRNEATTLPLSPTRAKPFASPWRTCKIVTSFGQIA